MSFTEELFDVRGKVVLVTGGSRGIGKMIAEGFVRAGAATYIASRKADACAETVEELAPHGICRAIVGDVATIEGCEAMAAELGSQEDHLDVLINNAGLTWSEPLDSFSEKAWDRVHDVNVKGPFFLTQQLLPLLRKAASAEAPASIVNISSVNALNTSNLSNYSYVSSKAGIQMLSRELAHALVSEHINVNVIAPGPFKSKMTQPMIDPDDDSEFLPGVPMQRWGRMQDVAGLAIMLSSTAGSYLTGVIIPCDGGITSR